MMMQNSTPLNNRNFGNRSYNSNDSTPNFGNLLPEINQLTNSNFYDDFDLNEFSKNVNNFDRPGNNRNFSNRQNFSGNDDRNLGNSNWRNQSNQFNNSRGTNLNTFGGANNDRFNNDHNDRNFSNQDNGRSGQHCIHMRGLPYYTDEMDVFNVSFIQLSSI